LGGLNYTIERAGAVLAVVVLVSAALLRAFLCDGDEHLREVQTEDGVSRGMDRAFGVAGSASSRVGRWHSVIFGPPSVHRSARHFRAFAASKNS
jgi:hypothetical protein